MQTKNSLRDEIKSSRKNLDTNQRHLKNDIILESVEKLVSVLIRQDGVRVRVADNIGLYWPISTEPNLLELQNKIKGCFYLPQIPHEQKNARMEFVKYDSTTKLEDSKYAGIKQPQSSNSHDDNLIPKIILVPALACSLDGYRLGFGSGYYDRYFATLKSQKIVKIGVCFHEYLYEKLPIEPHDIKLDYVITDKIILAL